MVNIKNYTFVFLLLIVFNVACQEQLTEKEKEYIQTIENLRAEKDNFMRDDSTSPFNFKGSVEFHPLNYFPVNLDFVFKSKLYQYDSKDTITIFGTKGEERKSVRFGYVKVLFDGQEYKINVYQGKTKNNEIYYSIWFTDKTTNEESYGVGRYLDFELESDTTFIYTIDFNLAYNPYCAYSPNYSCAIPTEEDYLNIAIEAGEKIFHE